MEAKTMAIQSSFSCYVFSFLFVFLLLISKMETILAETTTTKTSSTNTYKTYIETCCDSTTYPKDCYKALSPYYSKIKTNPRKLCKISLSVTLKTARNTSALVSSIAKQGGLSKTEKEVVQDCIEEIYDAVDELNQSLDQMNHLGGSDVQFQIDNIKTWVSAALTDEDTCLDEFDGKKVSKSVKNRIRKSVLKLAKQTSNSLALINKYLK